MVTWGVPLKGNPKNPPGRVLFQVQALQGTDLRQGDGVTPKYLTKVPYKNQYFSICIQRTPMARQQQLDQRKKTFLLLSLSPDSLPYPGSKSQLVSDKRQSNHKRQTMQSLQAWVRTELGGRERAWNLMGNSFKLF